MKTEVLWTEDDCTCGTEGHEGLGEAWLRLFGTPFNWKEKEATIDHGDSLEYVFGDVTVWTVNGAYHQIVKFTPG